MNGHGLCPKCSAVTIISQPNSNSLRDTPDISGGRQVDRNAM